MDHVRHLAGALEETLAELAAFVVTVPVIAFCQCQALRGFKAEAVNFGEREEQRPPDAGHPG